MRASVVDYDSYRSTDGILTMTYKLSDGSRWVVVRSVDLFTGRQKCRVLVADFEGDREHRSSLKAFRELTGLSS